MAGKFVITKGKDNKFYFNLKASNGQVILTSQGYKDKKSCLNGIDSVKKNSKTDARFEVKKSTVYHDQPCTARWIAGTKFCKHIATPRVTYQNRILPS